MRKRLFNILSSALVLILSAGCSNGVESTLVKETDSFHGIQGQQTPVTEEELEQALFIPGMVVVRFSEEMAGKIERSEMTGLTSVAKDLGLSKCERYFPYAGEYEERTRREGLHRYYMVEFDGGCPVSKAIREFESLDGVETAEGLRKIKRADMNDPMLSKLWGINSTANPSTSINVDKVWPFTVGDPRVIVCVDDEGIKLDHEDLKWNIAASGHYNFITGGTRITAGGVHGTHVAGTIAAVSNNGIGVSGIAGGSFNENKRGITLLSAQVFSGTRSAPNFAAAIKYGADNGALISQNSWGNNYDINDNGKLDDWELEYALSDEADSATKAAVDYFIKYAGCDNDGNQLEDSMMKGGLVCFAAGNDGISNGVPGNYPPVFAVGATAQNGMLAGFSNYGPWVDICAPGSNIVSTIAPGVDGFGSKDLYASLDGTSMACPHVSGVAALMISYFGGEGFTNEDLKELLLQGAKYNFISCGSKTMGPYLDAWGSLQYGIHKYKERDDNPPIIETDYEGDYKFRQWEEVSIPFHIYDPDEGDNVNVKFSIEGRGRMEAVQSKPGFYEFKLTCSLVTDYFPKKVRITATDIFEKEATFEFKYQVLENHKPVCTKEISPILINGRAEAQTISLDDFFTDEDEEALTYSVESTPSGTVEASIHNGILSIGGGKAGQAEVTVTAKDFMNTKATTTFKVVVREQETAVDFYPNPVRSILHVRTGVEDKDTRIRISSTSGNVMYDETLRCSVFRPVEIDMSAYAPGQYILQVNVDGKDYSKTIVKI